jgi:(p)ppGpp synthase/HD superfamily hydrolase
MNNIYLHKAIILACKAHDNQLDKAGRPYILHPLRLGFKFENLEEMIVAILHDVIETVTLILKFKIQVLMNQSLT